MRLSEFFGRAAVFFLALASLISLSAEEKERDPGIAEKGDYFVVLEVTDWQQKISYHIVPQSLVRVIESMALKQYENHRADYKDMSRQERKNAVKPKMAKVRVKKRGLRKVDDAEKVANAYLKRVPKNRLAETPLSYMVPGLRRGSGSGRE